MEDMKSYFFILADRCNIRAYRAEAVPGNRSPHLYLVQAITLAEARLNMSEKVTDEAGSFPVTDGAGGRQGRHQNSVAERHVEIEETRRLIKQIGAHINAILRQEQPGSWSFAAPSQLHDAVLEQVEFSFRRTLAESVARDLIKVRTADLLNHFSEVRSAPEVGWR